MAILLYILTVLAVFYGITALPAAIIAGIISRVLGKRSGIFTGCLVSWVLIDFIWRMITGHHITVLALAISVLIMYVTSITQKDNLTEDSKIIMGGEFFAILALIGFLIYKGQVVWY